MATRRRARLTWLILVSFIPSVSCESPGPPAGPAPGGLPQTWLTCAERTAYTRTARYAEVREFCRRLAAASPQARYLSFGRSGQGRELPLLALSSEQAFDPGKARASRKPLVLIQNGIHPGECEGTDASLALARDILITGTRASLLDKVNLLIIPIFNVDGWERFGPYNRINQNGPEEMGWRTTAVNLNLNRDYIKADAVEMQAWLKLWNQWQPDLLIDDHTTNGHHHRYDLFYAATTGEEVPEAIARWTSDTLLRELLSWLSADGYAALPYSFPRDARDLTAGIVATGPMEPRLSTGYSAACNRPAVLVETHALLPYARRVQATYQVLTRILEAVHRHAADLRTLTRMADRQTAATRGAGPDGGVPIRFELVEQPRRITYRAFQQQLRDSEVTGNQVTEYTQIPIDLQTDFFDQWRVSQAVSPPMAYLIPPEWTEVIRRIKLHGVRFFRLQVPQSLEVESYRFEDVTFEPKPYEGRQMTRFRAIPTRRVEEFQAGTLVVPLDQPRARVIVNLLEPDAPDSLVRWGFFNTIFERKEYFEPYILEPIARRMLAADPGLRAEFEDRLKNDQAFAQDPSQRLDFFYRRSPYWDARHSLYPVARLPAAPDGQ